MEIFTFEHSLKNIPIPSPTSYKLKLIEKIESVIKRMRWKANFFLRENLTQTEQKEKYGFKTRFCPGQCPELEEFEKDVMNIVRNVKFEKSRDIFQTKLKADIQKITESTKVLVLADKTTNIYELEPDHYKKLLRDNITTTYKKAPEKLENAINSEAKHIAQKLQISDRVELIAKNEAFITIKDHKDNFQSNPTCRLLNPSKSELGKVSKNIVEKIVKNLKDVLNVNQWKNTQSVIEWFNNIQDKQQCQFIQLDIKDFYPTISENTLNKTIEFAKEHININDDEIRIINHCRKSLLFDTDNNTWKKQRSDSSFDVTMGSYDGAEICELVGIYILSSLTKEIQKEHSGLYRDDGLIILKKHNGQQTDRKRKNIIKIFKELGFKIQIETKLKEVNFLDITLNLNNGTYRPYKKPNDKLLYINTASNHPPQVIKQLPQAINDRLSNNSTNKQIFDRAKPEYEEALKRSGFSETLTFTKRDKKQRNRKRNIIWFNPPYNKAVSTNIARTFLQLIDKHFPKSNKLHKIFNRNNIKVSYSCTRNIHQIISSHNKNIVSTNKESKADCNCRIKTNCPLNGNCKQESVLYKCTVTTISEPTKVYLGVTEGEFKDRFYKHQSSFNNKTYANSTSLSKYIWERKEQFNETPALKWEIVKSFPAYSNKTKSCNLCLQEKLAIITYPEQQDLLNKRNELISKCRHENKFLLKTFNTND